MALLRIICNSLFFGRAPGLASSRDFFVDKSIINKRLFGVMVLVVDSTDHTIVVDLDSEILEQCIQVGRDVGIVFAIACSDKEAAAIFNIFFEGCQFRIAEFFARSEMSKLR